MNNLASVLQARGELAEAEELYRRALVGTEKAYVRSNLELEQS